jgi:Zn-dependent peptidase ImmA (M78 family)
MGVRKKFVREKAQEILRKGSIKDAPVDVIDLAEGLGIEVKLEQVDDDLSGFLFREPSTQRAVIGANSKHHKNRQRFTIAHELGHYLLHETERIHLDSAKPGYIVQRRDKKSSTGEDLFEREANLFAAELLMPAPFLAKDLKGMSFDLLADDDTLLEKLAAKYGVSVQALTIRLDYLGYIHH